VHSLGILAAQSDVCKGFYPEQSRHNDRQNFNTAIFLILTGFTTWMQLLYAQKNIGAIVCFGVLLGLEKVNISTFC
jgi:hypothetical protein